MFGGLRRSYQAVMSTAANIFAALNLPRTNGFEFVRPKGTKRQRGSTFGGKRGAKRHAGEMARRVRQIECGQLTASNGLVSERNNYIKVNSHGRVHTFCRPCQGLISTPDGPGDCDFPNCADVRPNGCAC